MCCRKRKNKYLIRMFDILRQKCPGNLFLSILEYTGILFLYHYTNPALFQALKALASKKKKPNVEPVATKADSDSVSESSSGSDEEVCYSLTSFLLCLLNIVYSCLKRKLGQYPGIHTNQLQGSKFEVAMVANATMFSHLLPGCSCGSKHLLLP